MNARYHRQITRNALGHKVSSVALAAMINANLELDNLAGQLGHPEFHFDDNAFEATQNYMEQQRSLAIFACTVTHDSRAAQKAFGHLTHCSQDFYAHSNYTALWVNLHPGIKSSEIDPLAPEIMKLPSLHSGRIYLPLEILTYLPVIGRIFRYFLPRDAHAWMNLDSPASGYLFDFARTAATKRTGIEFDRFSSQLFERGGNSALSLLTGLSQSGLAEALGVTFQQVQKYEKGVNRIGAGRLFEISRILGVPIDFFYDGVGVPNEGPSDATPPVMEFVSSGEGLQLSLAFMKIRDPKVRKRVLDLVKSLAEEEEAS